ncbi:SusC/RagA family TonB-linked outer membrane protein [Reichenbachiella sp. MSK19-1]|nr:SusC/RagA family TonB-linked outer membrane protein [Reichenbachiella sp. MSK19-1]
MILSLSLLWSFAQAQDTTVKGQVKDETGETLPGVSILIKGTTKGTVTDLDGNYSITVSDQNAVLSFSFIGYITQEVAVGSRSTVDVSLQADIQSLEEVVVVGYGAQKKSVVTGAISSVKAKDLESQPISRVEQALQGRTSGITVASTSGQPGASSTIRIRGFTSTNDDANNPLWVVDGVVIDNGGIGYLNQSDIASIEVLKDAASQAIYGTRGASGVILVTTKKGQEGRTKVSYNGFYGTSAPARRLSLTNATEYATLMNESAIAAGQPIPYSDPQSLGEGTDWQDQIFNDDARRQNHELSISGGNAASTYYVSLGYWDQEGIVVSDISNYERFNVRVNSQHKIKDRITIGQNLSYAKDKSIGLGNTNSEFGGPLSSAINLDPITPAVETDPTVASQAPYNNEGVLTDANGNPYGISTIVGQELTNPLAYTQTRLGNFSWSDNVVGNVFAEVELIKGLKIKSNVGAKIAFWGDENFTPVFYLNSSVKNVTNSMSRSMNRRIDYNLENTISYGRTVGEHTFNVLLGQGAYQENFTRNVNVTYRDIPATNFDDASMNFSVPNDQITGGGSEGQLHTVSSLFARVNYNYGEKYLLTGVVRRDGSSRFGENNKYGFFPSVSAGWVLSRESFWPSNDVVNFFKLRAGYGIVGNDNIGDFSYLSTVGGGRNYAFGTSGTYVNGVSPNKPANPDLKWEETSQLNIGFEATIISNLNLTVEWYNKQTNGILMGNPIPGYVGAIENPAANLADMKNTGVEVELGYSMNLGELQLNFNGNVSYLQNEVVSLGAGREYLEGGSTFQASAYPITRTAVGHALNSFYGFKQQGIFQTAEDVQNHTSSDGTVIQPDAKPGDFIWKDNNDDGQITEEDRDFIGNPTPDWTYGLTIGGKYKNFDFSIFTQGVAGNEIFQGLRRLDVANANFESSALNRWTGPGSTNDYPRLVNGDPNKNFTNPSDFYLEDGSYFRLKTIQIGYSLPSSILDKVSIDRLRFYITAENLFTFTNYTGYDPEIGGGTMSIDRGIYPQARSFMAGINLNF